MKVIFSILFLAFLLFSCKKDKTPAPCAGVSMSGERELFVGKWCWYSTTIEEWFDIGPSNYYDYTPQNQGFEYYFKISNDGLLKGYRNDTLVNTLTLSLVQFENFSGSLTKGMRLSVNCTSDFINLIKYSTNLNNDSIHSFEYPINFNDQENHLISHRNYFVKEWKPFSPKNRNLPSIN